MFCNYAIGREPPVTAPVGHPVTLSGWPARLLLRSPVHPLGSPDIRRSAVPPRSRVLGQPLDPGCRRLALETDEVKRPAGSALAHLPNRFAARQWQAAAGSK